MLLAGCSRFWNVNGLLDYILYVSIRAYYRVYHVYIFYLDYHVYIFSERGLNDIEQLPYSKRESFTLNKIIIITNSIRNFELTFDFVYHGNMLSKHHRDSPPLATASRWNLSKFVVIKHFGWESSCCLDVLLYMLNCVFWRHITLEIEFKSPVDMGSDSNRYTAQRYNPWAVARLSTRKKKTETGRI